jgi:hypothetical protein
VKELFRTYLSGENTQLNLVFREDMPEVISVKIYTVSGQLVQQEILNYSDPGAPVQIGLDVHKPAYYIVHVHSGHFAASQGFIIP